MTGINISGKAPAPSPPITQILYGGLASLATTSDLYTVDPSTAAFTSVGASGFAITGLASRPSDNVLFGATSPQSSSNPKSLITLNTSTGAGTVVGAFGGTVVIPDLAFRSDDVLYGYNSQNRTLYTINTTTGTATQVSATAVPTSGAGYGLAFDSTDTLYLFPKTAAGGVFYIVDETTGGLTAQPALSGAPGSGAIKNVSGASFDNNDVCYIVLNTNGPAYWIATVDVATGVITSIGSATANADAIGWGV